MNRPTKSIDHTTLIHLALTILAGVASAGITVYLNISSQYPPIPVSRTTNSH